jgi:hypothetical protein
MSLWELCQASISSDENSPDALDYPSSDVWVFGFGSLVWRPGKLLKFVLRLLWLLILNFCNVELPLLPILLVLRTHRCTACL